MRLKVSFASNVPDVKVCWYLIQICDDEGELCNIKEGDEEKLRVLIPGIGEMCRKVLGDDFVKLDDTTDDTSDIGLCVKVGTSRGNNRFSFRSLLGWIELHDLT